MRSCLREAVTQIKDILGDQRDILNRPKNEGVTSFHLALPPGVAFKLQLIHILNDPQNTSINNKVKMCS